MAIVSNETQVALPTTAPAVVVAAPAVPVVAVPVVAGATQAAEVAAPAVVTADAGPAVQPAGDTAPVQPVTEDAPLVKLAKKIDAKREQYRKLGEEIQRLQNQFDVADKMAGIAQGSNIIARVGRADTAREVEATVVGVQFLDNGERRLKIVFGAGFDTETVVIQDSQIVGIKE
ncbi:hypothetical protein HOR51_gp17 [Ralstonia phage phiAp1]|uniref:Uncharacterized protein n=1 Tax=Ralstonia phage phiAp1 TaxID=2783867 RepID=A0A1L7DS41_9CAUD|nr:hypothetical protein HOR51_gp17 [Ralstonia phage phiAp1]APU03158.1 hypothetical protein phiAp1_17 [Ralstonia phage phiAp1]